MMDRSNWDFRKYTFFGELKDEEVIIINMHLVNFNTSKNLLPANYTRKNFTRELLSFFCLESLK